MQTILLGLDAFDPVLFEQLYEQGRLPNLARFVQLDGYARFAVANPPQSEVSWTSIATGLNPGGHGIFDFVHRNPATYHPYVSLLPTRNGLTGRQFVPPFTARTIFDQAVSAGYPATALWWPATFPARPQSPVRTIPGLGAPDIHGRLGVGTLFTSAVAQPGRQGKTAVEPLHPMNARRYTGRLPGPVRRRRDGLEPANLPLQLDLENTEMARLWLGRQEVTLIRGQWSPIVELSFKINFLFTFKAITRFILTQTGPEVQLYALPLQVHPLHAPWHYATPRRFVKKLWQQHGPFLTIGWPQDTSGLEDGCLSDDQFLALCDSIVDQREQILMHQIDAFQEGVLAAVFDSLDRVQHMFWRDRPDVIAAWYEKLDGLVGRVEQRLAQQGKSRTRLMILSDHGFANFDYKVHLNRWLVDEGYLAPQQAQAAGSLKEVDWSRSQAYALGLNSLYLNLAGREGEGSVSPGGQEALAAELRAKLLAWRGPDGRQVVQQVWSQAEAFTGPLAAYGPDLVVGFAPGYRASSQTGLGAWEAESLEPNRDHWRGDHCMDPAAVPGVIFASDGLRDFPRPSYRDIPALAVGATPDDSGSAPPPVPPDEDLAQVEERLRSLGYL